MIQNILTTDKFGCVKYTFIINYCHLLMWSFEVSKRQLNKHDGSATMASGESVSFSGRVSVRFTDAVPSWIDEYLVVNKKTRISSGTMKKKREFNLLS